MLPGIIVSAAALAIVFYFADIQELGQALRLADYRLVALGTLISLIWLVIRGMAWRQLLQAKASFKKVFFTLNEGYLLNNILPFRLGEVGRAFLLGRKTDLGFWQVLSSILIERALDLALAAALLLSTIPFVVGAEWAVQGAIFSGALVALGLVVLYFMARNREWTEQRIESLGRRWKVIETLAGSRLNSFLSGLEVLTEGGYFFRGLGLLVLDWLIAIFQYYVVLRAFFPDAQPLWAAFALGVAAVGIAAPSSPGAVGVLEAALVGALSLFGLNPSTALAFAITTHIIQILITGVLGSYALSRDGETLSGLYRSARGLLSRVEPGQD
jgi:glycosyltransferase 2 family protein